MGRNVQARTATKPARLLPDDKNMMSVAMTRTLRMIGTPPPPPMMQRFFGGVVLRLVCLGAVNNDSNNCVKGIALASTMKALFVCGSFPREILLSRKVAKQERNNQPATTGKFEWMMEQKDFGDCERPKRIFLLGDPQKVKRGRA